MAGFLFHPKTKEPDDVLACLPSSFPSQCAASSCEFGFFGEEHHIAPAQRFPIETVFPIQQHFMHFGAAPRPLGGATQNVHGLNVRIGATRFRREDDRWM